ncbi:hypothetical protein [Ensifer aridi]|uniref:hypothetical protein n=1 Tax=Ensifer aridi TaxID=1708715 RepID=UPI00047E0ACA|nr:hypothetical protein [Ensifer aridi]
MRVLLFVLGSMLAISGVLFRPFWLSEWGPYAFILLVWITTSLVMSWGGKGKPYSFRYGVIFGSGLALSLLVTLYSNAYVGWGVMLALTYLGFKTKFFARRSEQLRPDTTE